MTRFNRIIGKSSLGTAALAATFSLLAAASSVAAEPEKHVVKGSCDIQWQDPQTQTDTIQTIVLAGDPDRAGPYAVRLRIPPHFKVAPHFHTDEARFVTVLSGTLYYGLGDRFKVRRLRPLKPGTFFTEPAGLRHFAMTTCEEVILQLDAIGPAGTVVLAD